MSKSGNMVELKPGTGFLVEGTGPGVLVLHSWWGLHDCFKGFSVDLANAGFTALALDLYHGQVADEIGEAKRLRQSLDRQTANEEIKSAVAYLRQRTEKKIGVVGFSMGAKLALWAMDNCYKDVASTVLYYGTSGGRFRRAQAPVLGHFAEQDPYAQAEQIAALQGHLQSQNIPVTFHAYPGTQHWFAEQNRPEYEPAAAQLAWKQTIAFLKSHL
jgi:carboxymethylenebutenolidase